MRDIKLLLLCFLISFFLFGCSSNSSDPIAPIKPDNSEWHTATAFTGDPVTDDSYWNDSLIVRDKVWLAHRNPNGSVHYALGPGIETSLDPLDVISELGNIFLLPADNFRVSSDKVHAGLRIVMLRQYYDNLRVWPSRVQLAYGRGGKLVKTMADVFPIANLNTAPSISSEQATGIVLSETGETEIETVDLVIFSTQETSNLAYRVKTFEWIYFVDAIDGSILNSRHLVWDAFDGHIEGYVSQPNWYDPEILVDMPLLEMRVRVDPNESYPTSYLPQTNFDGIYDFNADESELEAELRLFGPLMNGNNRDGFPYNELSLKRTIFDGQSEDWLLDDTNSLRDERTVWYWSHFAWEYMKGVSPEDTSMDWRLLGNVQNGPNCNAFASGNSINFFKTTGDCLNLGEVPDVVVHEWGHVHQFYQQWEDIPPGMMLEGNADITANTVVGHPYIGWNARGEGDYFRLSDNELMWPLEECNNQSHCMGRLISGAFWDLEEMIGSDYHDYLWHYSKYLLGQTFQDWGADVLVVDDDDDNPLNGTPHYDQIFMAFETNHNLDIPDAVDIPTTGVIIDVVPAFPPIQIPSDDPNKSFSYNLKIMNLDDAPAEVPIWAAVELPWSAVFGPVIPPNNGHGGPINVPLAPLEVMEFDPTQTLPVLAPVGEYVYHVRIGEFVDNINDILIDDASFSFWIVD